MSFLQHIQEQELTYKEIRMLLRQILDSQQDSNEPIRITISDADTSKSFTLVHKKFRRNVNGEPFTIKEIDFDLLDTTTEPGAYITVDPFPIGETTSVPFIYGLYISYTGDRDLRFFNDESKCQKWLQKKIKQLEK